MHELTECCDNAVLYYVWEKSDGSIGYEPWEFCPQCLECCSLYNPKDRDEENRIKQLTEGANNDTIARANKRLAKELGFGRKDDVIDSENDNICDGLLYAAIQKEQSILRQNTA